MPIFVLSASSSREGKEPGPIASSSITFKSTISLFMSATKDLLYSKTNRNNFSITEKDNNNNRQDND